MKQILLAVLSLITICSYAQEETKIKVSAYLETYYSYDFNSSPDNTKPGFIYSHNRHNEVNVNLGFIKAAFETNGLRANLALMTGTYTNANLAAEPGVLKNIFEANAGIKLLKQGNLWLDAGVFSSHIGFESAVSKDCWVVTRHMSSVNTPYYEAGAKLTYATANNRFTISGLYLNGWQRIQRSDGNTKPAFGLQFSYRPNEKITLNCSNYIGSEGADSIGVNRYYNNIYAIYQLNNKLGVAAGFDFGYQQKNKGNSEYSKILSPVIIARYQLNPKVHVAGRYEYYEDESNIFISASNGKGFKTSGYSLNLDYSPVANAVLRIEGKLYQSRDEVFLRKGQPVNDNASLTSSIAISF